MTLTEEFIFYSIILSQDDDITVGLFCPTPVRRELNIGIKVPLSLFLFT